MDKIIELKNISKAFDGETVLDNISLDIYDNEFITLLKETSVVGYVGVIDLTKAGNVIAGRTYSYFIPLLTVAAVYLVMVMILSFFVGKLERRLRKNER